MEYLIRRIRVCPQCGKAYSEYPAISRTDGATEICPQCGIREALESIGVVGEEAENIIETVNRYTSDK